MRPSSAAIALLALGACGGGGGSQVPLTTVTGTAAANIALAGYFVTVCAPYGAPLPGCLSADGTAGPDGRFSATRFLDDRRPFVISATPPLGGGVRQYPLLMSVSYVGAANVTPLTTLLVARLLNRVPEFSIDQHALAELENRPGPDISAARDQVVAYLMTRPSKIDPTTPVPVDVSAVTDFVLGPLAAVNGDPHFEALKRLHDSMLDSETIQGTSEHMLFGNAATPDLLATLALDFDANCGVGSGTAPSGAMHVVLDRHGATVGSLDLPFQTGDVLTIDTSARTWTFAIKGSGASVRVDVFEGALSAFTVFTPSGSATCVSKGTVSLAGKFPSRFGLFNALRQAVGVFPDFQCTAPITIPGFQASNTLVLEPNGAARINGPNDLEFHLPSYNIEMNASIVVTAGQVSSIRATRFRAFRFFVGGNDDLRVAFTDTGVVTGLLLSRQRDPQPFQLQTCGTI